MCSHTHKSKCICLKLSDTLFAYISSHFNIWGGASCTRYNKKSVRGPRVHTRTVLWTQAPSYIRLHPTSQTCSAISCAASNKAGRDRSSGSWRAGQMFPGVAGADGTTAGWPEPRSSPARCVWPAPSTPSGGRPLASSASSNLAEDWECVRITCPKKFLLIINYRKFSKST